jgi:hypothetical protein
MIFNIKKFEKQPKKNKKATLIFKCNFIITITC